MSETVQVAQPVPTTVDPFQAAKDATVAVLTTLIGEANDQARVVKAAANQKAVISDFIETSDDETVAKYREQVEKAEAAMLEWEKQITAYVQANLLPKGDEQDAEKAREIYKEKKAAISGFTAAMKALPGGEEQLANLPELMSLGRGGNTGATGVKRPRVTEIYIKPAAAAATEYKAVEQRKKQDDGTEKVTVSFSVLAQKLKGAPWNYADVTARTILEHAEAVAGPVENWSDRDGEPFSFVISPENGEHVEVKVVP